jgi:peptidoglycan hydrolase-like protein with peptidoglycan-binding domain
MSVTELVPIPPNINPGVRPAQQSTLLTLLGAPRARLDNNCQTPTNAALIQQLVLRDLGLFHVYGLKPAVDDLERIFAAMGNEQSEVFEALGYSGMTCVRLVRGSTFRISNHSWGIAIDLNLRGVLDTPADDRVQRGLALIAPIFNQHGWYWGAGFGREDAMHFEVGDGRLRQWHAEGLLSGRAPFVGNDILSQGDSGPEVRTLQERLLELGYALAADGIFGPITRAVLVAFQTSRALRPTGMLDAETADALEEPEERGSVLRLGSTGPLVEQWQTFLQQQGLVEVGPVDGRFGPRTQAATRTFQAARGLVADGVVGPKTRAEAEPLGLGVPAEPGAPPSPVRRMRNNELTADIIQQASHLFQQHVGDPIGTEIPFTSAGVALVGKLEWHYDDRRGKHKGLSVFVPVA